MTDLVGSLASEANERQRLEKAVGDRCVEVGQRFADLAEAVKTESAIEVQHVAHIAALVDVEARHPQRAHELQNALEGLGASGYAPLTAF